MLGAGLLPETEAWPGERREERLWKCVTRWGHVSRDTCTGEYIIGTRDTCTGEDGDTCVYVSLQVGTAGRRGPQQTVRQPGTGQSRFSDCKSRLVLDNFKEVSRVQNHLLNTSLLFACPIIYIKPKELM